MPVYEYRCQVCGRKTSLFVRTMRSPRQAVCGGCGSTQMQRAVSAFAHHRTTKDVWDAAGPASMFPGDAYYRDPRNIGRSTEQRLEQLGVEMPAETRRMIDAAREGTPPASLGDP